jgi:hypothetical protein
VQCVDVAEWLLVDELRTDPELERHVQACASCTHVARGLERLDVVMAATLVVAPPLDLQRQLAQLAFDAGVPPAVPWWRRIGQFSLSDWLAVRPQMVAAQGLAAVMLALASWQVFGWLTAFQPVVGDVGYAVELVIGSPATSFLGGMQIDLQSMAIWSAVGLGGWLVSEDGLIGRWLSARQRQRLP